MSIFLVKYRSRWICAYVYFAIPQSGFTAKKKKNSIDKVFHNSYHFFLHSMHWTWKPMKTLARPYKFHISIIFEYICVHKACLHHKIAKLFHTCDAKLSTIKLSLCKKKLAKIGECPIILINYALKIKWHSQVIQHTCPMLMFIMFTNWRYFPGIQSILNFWMSSRLQIPLPRRTNTYICVGTKYT